MSVRSTVIHAKPGQVFPLIADLGKWTYWHPVFMHDSSIRYSKPAAGSNAFAKWSTNGKENKLAITFTGDNHVNASLVRTGEKNVDYIIAITSLPDSNNIQVEWRIITKLKWYPWEKFSGIFIDKITGPGYDEALNNLKQYVEGN